MKYKIVYVPTKNDPNGRSSTMMIPWDHVEEFMDELAKMGYIPRLMGDEVPSLESIETFEDGITTSLEQIIAYPLQVEE